jgi:CRP-like cAMP-binding protein
MAGQRLQYLTENDWVLMQAKATRHTFSLGEPIIREGDGSNNIFIIRRGEASVELAGSSSRAVLATLGPGDICGEIAFLERGRASAAVIAREEIVEVDEVSAADVRELFSTFPGLASRFYQSLATILAERLRVTTKELARELLIRDRTGK